MCRAPSRCNRRTWGSWPKFASSITAGPAFTLTLERPNENSFATTWTRAGGTRLGAAPCTARPATTSASSFTSRAASFHELRAGELRRVRNDPRRVEPEPLLEQGRVDGAKVRGRLQVPVRVEPGGEAGKLTDLRPGRTRADQERRSRCAVIGPAGPVLPGPPAELGPDERHHA